VFPNKIDVKLTEAIIASDPSSKKQVTNTAIAASVSSALLSLGKVFFVVTFGVTLPFHWPVTLGLGVTTLLITAVALSVIYGVNHRSNFKSVIALLLKEYDLANPESFNAAIKDIDAAIRWAVANKFKGSIKKFLEECEANPREVFATIYAGLKETTQKDLSYRKLVWLLLKTETPEKVESAVKKAVDSSYQGSFVAFAKACKSEPDEAFKAVLEGFGSRPSSDYVALVELLLETHSLTEVAGALSLALAVRNQNDTLARCLQIVDGFFQNKGVPDIGTRQILKRSPAEIAKLNQLKIDADKKIQQGHVHKDVEFWFAAECLIVCKEMAKSVLRDAGSFPEATRGLVLKTAASWLPRTAKCSRSPDAAQGLAL